MVYLLGWNPRNIFLSPHHRTGGEGQGEPGERRAARTIGSGETDP